MKILLHGAINGTNFGDCLFADIFYKALSDSFGNKNIYFYDIYPFGIGHHLRGTLNYKTKLSLSDYAKFDALVFISGGYFGDGNKSYLGSLLRYFRYVLLGLYAIKKNIDIYVVGLEVGPIHHGFVRKAITRILSNSKLTIVRNEDSKRYVESLGISNVLCTADTAISLNPSTIFEVASSSVKTFVRGIQDHKIIFLHLLSDDRIDERFREYVIRPIITFVKSHQEYCVVYGTDGGKRTNDFRIIDELLDENEIPYFQYHYTDYNDMCYLLNHVSIIITKKLHVGIVGATLNKSVISTPIHLYKTMRFYKQIGEEQRCIQYNDLERDSIYKLLDEYGDKQIAIPPEIINKARLNLELLIESLGNNQSN